MSYAGDLTPTDAHRYLLEHPNAVMVDVRTAAEWNWVGIPDIDGIRFVEWSSWPTGARNESFVEEAAQGLSTDQPMLLLCRSGARSIAAANALTEAGFSQCYNVLDGFEGPLQDGHRSGGWRGAGLPWKQG